MSFRHLSDQIRSVVQLCPTLCDPMNRSTRGKRRRGRQRMRWLDGRHLYPVPYIQRLPRPHLLSSILYTISQWDVFSTSLSGSNTYKSCLASLNSSSSYLRAFNHSRAAPGKSGLHARGEGERVLALESREEIGRASCRERVLVTV